MFFLNFRAVCSGCFHPTSYSIVHQPRFFWRGFTLQSYVPNNYTCFKILISLHTVDGWNLAPYISDVSNPVKNGIDYPPQLVLPDFFHQQYHYNSFTNCICDFSCNFRDLMMISAAPSRKIWWQSHPWKAWAFLKQKGKRKISLIEEKQNFRVTEIPSEQNLAKFEVNRGKIQFIPLSDYYRILRGRFPVQQIPLLLKRSYYELFVGNLAKRSASSWAEQGIFFWCSDCWFHQCWFGIQLQIISEWVN